jgi:tetratricopeptide (TPR) repeat protein
MIPALVEVLVANDVAVMPDLCFSFGNLLMWDDLDHVWTDPEIRYTHPNTVADWRAGNINRRDEIENFVFREQIKYELLQELTRAFQAGGVLQVIGTDSSLPGLFPGKAAHSELTELVKSGLSNFDALSIGTSNAGAFVRKYIDDNARFGRVAPGYRADLMLIDGNPLEDVRNARNIAGVAAGGRWFDAAELGRQRDALALAYESMNQLLADVDRALQRDDPEAAVRDLVDENTGNTDRLEIMRDRLNSAGYAAAFDDDLERARDILALATRIFPDSANAWDSLAEINLYMGERDPAIEHYKKALEIDPDLQSAKTRLRELQQK